MADASDETPPERPPLAVNPAYAGIVRALHNHALCLDGVRRNVEEIRDRFATATAEPMSAEMDKLGRAFRHESDTAAGVARQAEEIARRAG